MTSSVDSGNFLIASNFFDERPEIALDDRIGTQSGLGVNAPGSPLADQEVASLTKAKLAEMLFEKIGLKKSEAKDIVDAFFDEICSSLKRGETITLSGFGNFNIRDKTQRPGRNPKTGEIIQIGARRVVTFRASRKLKIAAGSPKLKIK